MKQEIIDIGIGIDLARKSLVFACFYNGKVTSGECREAIQTLFGEEVNAVLQSEYQLNSQLNHSKEDKTMNPVLSEFTFCNQTHTLNKPTHIADIVKCVNSHNELVVALTDLVATANMTHDGQFEIPAFGNAYALLAKVAL